ncbi:MAG: DNA-processing protein DprA [Varibaculum sp.]|nr:DNA-processing protein DprA [Varibaculum sp.]
MSRVKQPVIEQAPAPDRSDDERFAAAAWTVLAEPTDKLAAMLIAHMGAAESYAWVKSNATLPAGFEKYQDALSAWRLRLHKNNPETICLQAADLGIGFLAQGDEGWPEILDTVPGESPWGIWVRGRIPLQPMVAVVGSRACSQYGRSVAAQLGAELSQKGYCVVSGGAYGIDSAAHSGALSADTPPLAVMAGGLHKFYPAASSEMITQVANTGAVVSQYPPGYSPSRWRFLARNRMIAAFAQATVIVEAASSSGALNTAKHARELGRILCAVPGSVRSPQSVGCNELIRSGAQLVTNAAEVAELLTPLDQLPLPKYRPVEPELDRVWAALPLKTASTLDRIATKAGYSLERTGAYLGQLVMQGRVVHEGQKWRRAKQ